MARVTDSSASVSRPKPHSRVLPPRPDLEQLRKKAKEQLADLREADPQAKLADAQHVLAKSYGFKSWRDLKAYIDYLNSPQRDRQVRAFFDALRRNDRAAVKSMLDDDATLAYADLTGQGHRPLCVAADAENQGAEPGMVDLLFEYPLPVTIHDAAAVGKTGIVASVTERNPAELNATEGSGRTPLHLMAERGDAKWIRGLLDKGADPDATLPTGEKPFDLALKLGHTEAVEALRAVG